MNYNCIDLFCGSGGLARGFHSTNIKTVFANDFDKEISNSYKTNFPNTPFIEGDISSLNYNEISNNHNIQPEKIDVIIGGPPCQGYSMANRKRIEEDERNLLFLEFIRCVLYFKPKCFLIENVVGMKGESINHKNKNTSVLSAINDYFDNINEVKYKIGFRTFKSEEYGVPQFRRRIILIGTRIDSKKSDLELGIIGNLLKSHKSIEGVRKEKQRQNQISLLDSITNPTSSIVKEPITIWDAISDLPDIESGDGSKKMEYASTPQNNYQELMREKSNIVFNHISTPHSEETLKRIKLIKQGENFESLPKELKTKSVHSGAYGRLEANSLSPTITTRFDTPSTGRVIHPFKNRTITVREAARIQSFPDHHQFTGTRTSQGKQIGNAVPPLVGKKIAEMFIKDFLS
jgi:DNA (cytosine-5)-methyltransferase 1